MSRGASVDSCRASIRAFRFILTVILVVAMSSGARRASAGEFEDHVAPFLGKYCGRCHGEKRPRADFALHDIDGVVTAGKDTVRWEKVLEFLSLGDMPPEKARQPSKRERQEVVAWISRELRKIGRGLDEGKLALPLQANRVSHEELFSGEHKGPASSPARLWRKSPHIYWRFANELRVEVSQPFLGLGGKGIQDYASLLADEAAIKTLLRNSGLIAAALFEPKRGRFRGFFAQGREPNEEEVERLLRDLFRLIYQRDPTDADRARYIDGLFRRNRELGGLKLGLETLVSAMLMSQEFIFRLEIGLGEELPDGRRRLGPLETAYALSFAFFDTPDRELMGAAQNGQLSSKEGVERAVRAILDREDPRRRYWNYPMYHQWGGDYYQLRPRVLRFFQEFFGYTACVDVFKDRERNHDHHALRLRKDADLFVLSVLERDRDVLAELLTSNRYPVDHVHEDRIARAVEEKKGRWFDHLRSKYPDEFDEIVAAGKWPGLDSRHVSAYGFDRKSARAVRRDPGELLELPANERAGMLTHPAWLVAHSGNFDNDPIRRGKWIREHLLADLVPDVPIGVDARVPEDPHRTLRERMEVVEKAECWRCHRKMNPLGTPFEVYDDFGRHRESVVLGDADAYLKAKRRFDDQTHRLEDDLERWRRLDAAGRAEKLAEAERHLAALEKPSEEVENYPAQLRRYENDLRRWSKERETWAEMTEDDRQRKIADLKKRLESLEPPVAETKPVDSSGVLDGTGDPELDGAVRDAVDLCRRLARSTRVRQSFIRHAFRFWMGRNETLDDASTLIAADRAYVESGGSFRELLVSILTSDSFLYRH